MSHVFDLYVPGQSWLHRLDPRVKLWGVVVSFAAAFWVSNLAAQLVLLATLHLLLLSVGLAWRVLRGVWRQMGVLIVLILILQPFFQPAGQVLLVLGPLRLTLIGLYNAALLATRVSVMAFIMSVLLFTTHQRDLVRALVRLGFPYTWGLTISLTLRFLPAIQSLFVSVRDAQAARGWVPQGGFIRRLREYLPVLVAVIIGTLRLSDQLTLALAARGLDTSQARTVWRDVQMRRFDWFVFTIITAGFVGLLGWQLYYWL